MSTAVGPEGSPARSPRWQVSLGNLMILVLAAGVATGLARGAREVWGTRTVPPGSNGGVPLERTVGVVLEMMAVLLILMLVRALLGLFRSGRSGAGSGIVFLSSIAWRLAAIVVLLGFVGEERGILQIDFMTQTKLSAEHPHSPSHYSVRQGLLPICGLLAMLGLTLGMGAGEVLEGPSRRYHRPYWVFVPLATLAGLLFLAQPGWWSLIPQIHLIATEAMTNAMPHVLVRGPSLSLRLLRAGIDAGVALMVCLALALIVAHDFERARRAEPWATSRRQWLVRLLMLMATLVAGIYLAFVTFPANLPFLADCLYQVLEPPEVVMLLSGFGLFAAGLAARSVAGRLAQERPRWLVWLSALLRLGILGLLLLSALKYLPLASNIQGRIPAVLSRLLAWTDGVHGWLWSRLPDPVVIVLQGWLAPEPLLWSLTMLGLTMLIAELALTSSSQQPSPFNAVAESRVQAARFLWLSTGLTVVCLVGLTILLVGGQTLIHLQLRAEDLATKGWHSVF
jgi:hypothetical protein